jgi:hypothetical protein
MQPPRPFRLEYLPRHSDRFRAWQARANSPEARAALRTAFRHIEDLMRTQPSAWGDPIRDLRHARLSVRRGIHSGMIVEYAVDEARRIVYIAHIRLAPWHPLYQPDE